MWRVCGWCSLLAEDQDVQRVDKESEEPFERMVSEMRVDFPDHSIGTIIQAWQDRGPFHERRNDVLGRG